MPQHNAVLEKFEAMMEDLKQQDQEQYAILVTVFQKVFEEQQSGKSSNADKVIESLIEQYISNQQ